MLNRHSYNNFSRVAALAANTVRETSFDVRSSSSCLSAVDFRGPPQRCGAMMQIWSGLVRRDGRSDRGSPEARELALLSLAELSLTGADALNRVMAIDPLALEGLRHDGLLRSSTDDPFQIGPEFSHDEVRRYAVARLMLASTSITSRLVDAHAPRWALGAARLACQVRFAAEGSLTNPMRERFSRVQQSFDVLTESGHGALRRRHPAGEALPDARKSGTCSARCFVGVSAPMTMRACAASIVSSPKGSLMAPGWSNFRP